MAQIKVIVADNIIYATQFKTVVFKKTFSDELEKELVKIEAQSCAFCYAIYEVKPVCDIVHNDALNNDEAIFAYLEKCHPGK